MENISLKRKNIELYTITVNNAERLHACKGFTNSVNHSVDGEENKSFKRKPSKTPRRPTKMAKLKENPGSPLRFLCLFSMSYTFKRTNGSVILICNSTPVSTIYEYDEYIKQLL